MNIQEYEQENIVKTISLLNALFGTPQSNNFIMHPKNYRKYLDIRTTTYFFGGMFLSDFLTIFKKKIEEQKTNDILDDTFIFSEYFIIETLINVICSLCKKKDKDLRSSVQLLYIILEDEQTIAYLHKQLDFIANNGINVEREAYKIISTPQKFHLFLLKKFIKECKR